MDEKKSVFPERLRRLIVKKGVAKHVISENCGLSGSVIGKYEKGERSPTADAIVKLATYFGVSADYLLGLSDKQNEDSNLS